MWLGIPRESMGKYGNIIGKYGEIHYEWRF
jgi:hypothetical protein